MSIMAKLILHNTSLPAGQLARERALRFLQLSPQEKLTELFALIRLSVAMNGGQPLKQPQGKGLIIQRKNKLT